MAVSTNWEKNVALRRQHRASLIPLHWQVRGINKDEPYRPLETLLSSGVLTHEELALTDLTKDATSTLRRIASGELTAEGVVAAYCKRAAAADSLTNFITEVNFEHAIRRAKELDRHLRDTGSPVGPLHGLPFTVKDHMDLQGLDTSTGVASLCFDPAASNGLLVQILVNAGAVVIAKTNMPQTGFCADTDSIVFGRTLNAHNSLFGAGGSSGGEGSALGMGESLFGLGSDGAGSARMPAMANGVVGYRPSGYRLPADGRSPFDPGMIGITQLGPVATFGLMGHSVRDIRTVSKIVADTDTTFTAVYNCTDWPAIVLPLGMRCDKELDQAYTDFSPFGEKDAQIQALYEPEKFHGLPLAVQLAGQKFQDEKLLAIAELIHPIIRGE